MKHLNNINIKRYKSKMYWCYFNILLNFLFLFLFLNIILYNLLFSLPLYLIFIYLVIVQSYKIKKNRKIIEFLNKSDELIVDKYCKITNEAEQYTISTINSKDISIDSFFTIPGQYFLTFTNGDYSYKFDLNDGDHLIFFGEYPVIQGEKRSFDYLNTDKSLLNYRIEKLIR